jgi:hypothetical protein
MKKAKDIWFWFCMALLAFVLIWGIGKGCQEPKPAITYHDTIYKDSFIMVPVTKYVEILVPNVTGYQKPLRDTVTIIKWKTNTIGPDDVIELHRDTLQFNVKAQFIVNYPKNPKLIRQTISHDSVTYDFLRPDARVWTNTYPIDLDRYQYVWEADSMKKVKRGFFKQVHGESWAYAGYDIFRKAPRLAVDYAFNYRSVGIYGRANISTAKPYLFTEVGTKVKLK